jgi:tetratricopeptide (TPR) repeat protein
MPQDTLNLPVLRDYLAAEEERLAQRKQWLRVYGWIAPLAVGVGAVMFPLGRNFRPDTYNFWTTIFALAFVSILVPSAVNTWRDYQKAAKRLNTYAPPFVPRLTQWHTVQVMVGYGILIVGCLLTVFVPAAIIPTIGFYVVLLLWVFCYQRLLNWATRGGLARMERVLRIFPNNLAFLTNQSVLLLHVGRIEEAEHIIRELLERHRKRNIYAGATALQLNNLGVCLTFEGRFAEALPILEASVRIEPKYAHTYDSIASWYLDQNLDPERALELSELAVELPTPDILGSQPVRQATSARALALTGRDTRAEALLEQALSTLDQARPEIAAETYRQAAYARLAQGDRETAEAHFKRAVALDPDGLFGKLAGRALEADNFNVPANA